MRRLAILLVGIALLPTGIACHHLAGKCDCQPNMSACCKYGLYPSDPTVVVPATQPPPVDQRPMPMQIGNNRAPNQSGTGSGM